MLIGRAVRFGLVVISAVVALAIGAAPASAQGATVVRLGPEEGCQLGPTDVPEAPVTIPANCLIVFTPSGNANLLLRAQIPAGFSVSETFTTEAPCFIPGAGAGSGRLVVTKSGQITAHCHFRT